ncbi:MAG TPA: hypothetical protein PLU23_02260, partial [Anaerolineaceae bacterium]|nr:hypothetical protein [Anaerolineaceae bacterium]
QNLSLMERLYPVTLLLAGVIEGVLCLLLVLNQAKDTALLRMLGVEKHRIKSMQVSQTLLLTAIGLLISMILLIVLRGLVGIHWGIALAVVVYLSGALLGLFVGSVLVANKKPMELLQVKE